MGGAGCTWPHLSKSRSHTAVPAVRCSNTLLLCTPPAAGLCGGRHCGFPQGPAAQVLQPALGAARGAAQRPMGRLRAGLGAGTGRLREDVPGHVPTDGGAGAHAGGRWAHGRRVADTWRVEVGCGGGVGVWQSPKTRALAARQESGWARWRQGADTLRVEMVCDVLQHRWPSRASTGCGCHTMTYYQSPGAAQSRGMCVACCV